MALIVQKYGGTSVGDPERIKNVARRVAKTKKEGNDVVVVVSAMAGETDRLINLTKKITEDPDPREMDMVVSTGEQVSIGLLAMALHDLGIKARSFTGAQVGILTDTSHTRARIKNIEAQKVKEALGRGEVAIVAGFQGITAEEDITTLGRGGSDTSAVAVAAAIKANVCEIFTDVDGVYTTDPNIVPEARKLERISYDEMLEMASLGAKVLQTRSVEFGKNFNVPIHVRSSFNEKEGTWVVKEDRDMEKIVVSGVTYNKNEAKVSITRVPDKPGIAGKIFGAIADANVSVDMIIQDISQDGYTDISFTIPKGDLKKVLASIEPIAKDIGAAGVIPDDKIAKVSIVGVGMRSHSGVAARMFSVLAKENINIIMISTSEIKISCVIEAKYTELAVRVLHQAFGLSKQDTEEEKF